MNLLMEKPQSSIELVKKQLIDDFDLLGDWQHRYEYLIDLGRHLMTKNEQIKTGENRFYGCQANVWLSASYENQLLKFEGTSDSVIVAGLIALLLKVYSNRTPREIVDIEPDFIEKTGLIHNLTSQRSTGLLLMIEHMKRSAKQHL